MKTGGREPEYARFAAKVFSMNDSFDLHVVGAGPAGSFAACAAAKRGHSVLVSEEHAAIGEPVHCSGLVSASGLEQMSHIVPFKKTVYNPIRRANLHGRDSSIHLSFRSPKAYVFDRGAFDRLAAEKASDLGAKIETSRRIAKLSDFQSSNVIGADGPDSTVARLFNFPRIPSFACAWQGDFSYRSPDLSAVEVFFNPEFAPGFIGWIIPTSDESAKIGIGVSLPKSLIAAKGKFLSQIKLSQTKCQNEFSAIIPIAAREKTSGKFGKFNVCLAGDAAGQVKASSGGGIFFGAMCGQLAGENFANPKKYEQEWRKKYHADLLLHSLLRKGLDLLTPSLLDAWLESLKMLKIDFVLTEEGEMDEYSKMASMRTLKAMFSAWTK